MGLGLFVTIGISLVIIAVVLGIGAYIMTEIYDQMPLPPATAENTSTYQHNITNATLVAMNTTASWLNIFVIVAIAVGLIGMIFMFAGGASDGGYRRGGGGGGRTRL